MISQLKHMTSNEFAVSVHGMLRMHAHIATAQNNKNKFCVQSLDWTGLDWTPSRIENSALF